jgi:hypothetical protein
LGYRIGRNNLLGEQARAGFNNDESAVKQRVAILESPLILQRLTLLYQEANKSN